MQQQQQQQPMTDRTAVLNSITHRALHVAMNHGNARHGLARDGSRDQRSKGHRVTWYGELWPQRPGVSATDLAG